MGFAHAVRVSRYISSRLEDRKMNFYVSTNNSIVAVISEEHATRYALARKAGGDPLAVGCKVFTFCGKERMERGVGVEERMTFSGTYEDLDRLIKAGGHELIRGGADWDGYVPFSNGHQYGYCLGGLLPGDVEERRCCHEASLNDIRFVTTLGDVIEVFGADAVVGKKQ